MTKEDLERAELTLQQANNKDKTVPTTSESDRVSSDDKSDKENKPEGSSKPSLHKTLSEDKKNEVSVLGMITLFQFATTHYTLICVNVYFKQFDILS